MKQFVMSKFTTSEDMYKAKSECWEKRFKCLALLADNEISMPDYVGSYKSDEQYFSKLTEYIDSEIEGEDK